MVCHESWCRSSTTSSDDRRLTAPHLRTRNDLGITSMSMLLLLLRMSVYRCRKSVTVLYLNEQHDLTNSWAIRHVVFECPALNNLRIKHLGTDFVDKQVLVNNPKDVAEFLLEIDRYWVDQGQKTKKKNNTWRRRRQRSTTTTCLLNERGRRSCSAAASLIRRAASQRR